MSEATAFVDLTVRRLPSYAGRWPCYGRVGNASLEEHWDVIKSRELIDGLMGMVQDRLGRWGPARAPREIGLGGGLAVTDITGRARVDPHAIGLMLRYLDPGDTMVDVGAGIGVYSVIAGAMLGERGRVEAFEPSPTLRPCLEENLRRNGLGNVRIHAKLVGGRPMIDPFSDGKGFWRRRRVPARRDRVAKESLLQIPTVQLDELLVGRPCQLLRIDVAGYELRVLEGAEGLLRRPSGPALLIAFDRALADYGWSPRQLIGWLAAHGYETCFYDGRRHMILHVAEPWRLHRMLFAFPRAARNRISQRLARRADAA
jgi:FkbM family methyltransferase